MARSLAQALETRGWSVWWDPEITPGQEFDELIAAELDAAIIVNPFDTEGVAEAIQQAVNMPLVERIERHQAMMSVLQRNDINAWTERFVADLERVHA